MDRIEVYAQAAKGLYGTVGLYTLTSHVFVVFGLVAFPALLVIDAPFGRFGSTRWSCNGTIGFLLMELVSPLAFVIALATPNTATGLSSRQLPSLSDILSTFRGLPPARSLLAVLFLLHYTNRSIIQTIRNPGRSRMSILVPLAAIFWNTMNGFLMGTFVAGGAHSSSNLNKVDWASPQSWGIQQGSAGLFGAGCVLWAVGLTGNIYSDETLYSLRRHWSPTSSARRYSIPHGPLYDWPFGGISHPSYFCEWVEWLGFLLASLALADSSFPMLALAKSRSKKSWNLMAGRSSLLSKVPPELRPFKHWTLQPPALFLFNEVAVMLPRAISGHAWYQRTFGARWPKERKIVIPGVY